MTSYRKKSKRVLRTPLIVGVLVLLVVVLAGVTYYSMRNKTIDTFNTGNKGETASSIKASRSSAPTKTTVVSNPNVPGGSTGDEASTTATLATPTGTFVSNHHPNLSGSPAPNTVNSVCITAPGASCEIQFTQGVTTKTLPAKLAGPDGAVSWNWNLQNVGLSSGNWQVEAIATLGNQIKTAQDSMNLDVQQ